MAMTANNNPGGLSADINVTPLIDVLLVLLIIFMVIVPMVPRDLRPWFLNHREMIGLILPKQ